MQPLDIRSLATPAAPDTHLTTLTADLTLILAADIIYDDAITDALVPCLVRLLSHSPRKCIALLSVDWRVNFRLSDLTIAAHARDYFVNLLQESGLEWVSYFGSSSSTPPSTPSRSQTLEEMDHVTEGVSVGIGQKRAKETVHVPSGGFLSQMSGDEWKTRTYELFEVKWPSADGINSIPSDANR